MMEKMERNAEREMFLIRKIPWYFELAARWLICASMQVCQAQKMTIMLIQT